MIFDVRRRYPREYHHRHKCHVRPEGFGYEGQAEMVFLLDKMDYHVKGVKTEEERKFYKPSPYGLDDNSYIHKEIYPRPPHVTADNYFSGCNVLDHAGEKGYGLTMTTQRGRIPKGLKPFVHHEKLQPGSGRAKRAKVMRFENPIVAINQVPANDGKKAYTKTLVSFQSTGATNISGVNNLPSVGLYVKARERGRGKKKRKWGIEQNEARDTYLNFYYGADNVDHMIQIAMIRFTSWKYWHAPCLHALSIVVVAAYDMYQECCDGELDKDWYIPVEQRMDFRKFRSTLAEEMLSYDPKKKQFQGDTGFRRFTQQNKKRRVAVPKPEFSSNGVTIDNYKRAKYHSTSRLCGDLSKLGKHMLSTTKTTNMKENAKSVRRRRHTNV